MKYLPLIAVERTEPLYEETLKCENTELNVHEFLYDLTQNSDFSTNKYHGIYQKTNNGFCSYAIKEGKDDYHKIGFMYTQHIASIIFHEWSKSKQVYCPDNDFLDMLLDVDSIDIFPNDFSGFPYHDFYIDLSGYDKVNADGIFVKIDEFKDKNNRHFISLYYQAILDNSPKFEFRFPEFVPLMVINDGKFKEGYHVTRADYGKSMIQFKNKSDISKYELTGKSSHSSFVSHNADLTFLIIRFLLFLNIKEPDIQESEITKNTYRPYTVPKNKFSEIRKWDVGVRYGEKIRLWKEQQKHYYGGKNGKSSSPRPHLRRGHFSHVWCGPKGNQYLKLVFIHELFVNGTSNDVICKINQIESEFKDRYDGERCISQWLDANHIPYERQKYIPEIRKYFDFYVNNKYMIEFDGEQHFKPVEHFGGKEKFEQQQKYDQIKNKWCLDNRIPLIRIRYDEKPLLNQILSGFFKEKDIEMER